MCNRPFSEFEYRTGLVATSNAAGAMNRPSWRDLLWTNGGADLFTCCHRRGGWGEYREAKTNCRSYLAVLSDELAFARRVFFHRVALLHRARESSRMHVLEIERFLLVYSGVFDRSAIDCTL